MSTAICGCFPVPTRRCPSALRLVDGLVVAVGSTPTNVAVLTNGCARAVRFSTLDAICRVLRCQPSDILSENIRTIQAAL